MRKKKILAVFGTRPDAIKMCPLVRELRTREEYETVVAVTGQHREMLDAVLNCFRISPDYDLALMRQKQDLFDLTAGVTVGLRPILSEESPDLVLVHGDTTTAFGAALAAFYLGIPVGHVEAGLRTYDLLSPFPEEWNRRAIGLIARYHFAPTERARANLAREGVADARIAVTGNTGIDALRFTVREDFSHPALGRDGERLILVTAHRRESRGEGMKEMMRGLRRAAEEFEKVRVLFPVHPSCEVRETARRILGDCPRIELCEPLDVLSFHNLLARCYLCVTDSGGIQEEAIALGKPVLVMRRVTERPEGVAAGGSRLIGTAEGSVYRGIRELLENPALYSAMSGAKDAYGDGRASARIADFLERSL